jgi:hypothetical protein
MEFNPFVLVRNGWSLLRSLSGSEYKYIRQAQLQWVPMPPTVLVTEAPLRFLSGFCCGLKPWITWFRGGAQAAPPRVGSKLSLIATETGCKAPLITCANDADKIWHITIRNRNPPNMSISFWYLPDVCYPDSKRKTIRISPYLIEFLRWPPVMSPSFEPISAMIILGCLLLAFPQSRIFRA